MRIKTFPHGIHPPEFKDLSKDKAFEVMPAPEKVVIPLLQHFGAPAKPLVKKGDEVFLGQKIGEAPTLFSAAVHSSVSGKVLSVDGYAHPLGKTVPAVTIQNDGEDRPIVKKETTRDPFALDIDIIRKKVKEAGIVGMGGAAFPTAVKLTPPKGKPIDKLVRKTTGAKQLIVGIEDNKKDAYQLLKDSAQNSTTEIALVKTKYPQGAEKNLISALLGRKVPRGGLPFDVGVVVQNVATAKAIWDAVSSGKPLYERPLTVSGLGIKKPKNLIVRIGTSFQEVADFCGGIHDEADTLIMGGPMMGLSQWMLEIPVIKGTSGILVWKAKKPPKEFACVQCSRCVDHCPMGLVPTQLMKKVKYDLLDDAEAWGILDCVECGSCQYSCPANIPLVHWLRLGKNKIISSKRKKSA
jgi:electron transport complex protein RnfC